MWTVSFLIYLAFIFFEYFSRQGKSDISQRKSEREIIIFSVFAIILRVILSFTSKGYQVDINCFMSWAMTAAEQLPWNFYENTWCDYPPGYLYILGFLGVIEKLFPDMSTAFFVSLLKLPSIICDILIGVFIYKFGRKHQSHSVSAIGATMYFLSPAAVLNGAVWGQVDSIFTLLMLLTLYFLCEEKYYKSAILFGICLTVKMQAVMFAPLFLFVLLEKFMKTKNMRLFLTFIKCILLGIFTAFLVALPFASPWKLLSLYQSTTTQYPYASLNAFNLFGAMGKNLASNAEKVFSLSFKSWGNLGIIFSVLLTGVFYLKARKKEKLFYTAAILISLIFMLSSDMHERYLYPAMALFLAAAVMGGDFKTFLIFLGVTLSQYINVGYVYYLNTLGQAHCQPNDVYFITGSILTCALVIFAAVYGFIRGGRHEGK